MPPELSPERPAVTSDTSMDQFVENDVVRKVRRQDGQPGVELDAAGGRGAAPERALGPHAQSFVSEAVFFGQSGQTSGEMGAGGLAVEALGR